MIGKWPRQDDPWSPGKNDGPEIIPNEFKVGTYWIGPTTVTNAAFDTSTCSKVRSCRGARPAKTCQSGPFGMSLNCGWPATTTCGGFSWNVVVDRTWDTFQYNTRADCSNYGYPSCSSCTNPALFALSRPMRWDYNQPQGADPLCLAVGMPYVAPWGGWLGRQCTTAAYGFIGWRDPPGIFGLVADFDSYGTGQTTAFSIRFRHGYYWPSNGAVKIVFPPTIRLTGATQGTTWNPPHTADGGIDTYSVNAATRTIIVKRTAGSQASKDPVTGNTPGSVMQIGFRVTNVLIECVTDASIGIVQVSVLNDPVSGPTSATSTGSESLAIPLKRLVVPTTASVTEGATASLTIQLNYAPSAAVTVTISSANPLYLQVTTPSVVIPKGQVSGTISFKGLFDKIVNSGRNVNLLYGLSSPDPSYNIAVACSQTVVTVINADVAEFRLSLASTVTATVLEGSTTPISTAVLSSMPSSNVYIALAFNAAASGILSYTASSLIFTPANWNIAQDVVVVSVDNYVVDSTTTFTASLTMSSPGDTRFNTFLNFRRTVEVVNDDSYPVVTQVVPVSLPTQGGGLITVLGKFFGQGLASFRRVSVGGTSCQSTVFVSDSVYHCVPPVGAGTLRPVRVSVYTFASPPLYNSANINVNYQAPAVTSVIPVRPFALSPTITIFGTNFGVIPTGTGFSVQIGGTACLSYTGSTSHFTIVCQSASGTGAGRLVRVTVDGQFSSAATSIQNTISYKPPVVSRVVPAPGAVIGGDLVTVSGLNFGPGKEFWSAPPTGVVTIGTGTCAFYNYLSDSAVVCKTPPGTGTTSRVAVTVTGLPSVDVISFPYRPPSITLVLPVSVPPAPTSAVRITVYGNNFGFGGPLSSVSVSGTACKTPTWTSDTMFSCLSPSGVGASRPVVVTVTNQPSQPAPFGYLPPMTTAVLPSVINAQGGMMVTLLGYNFGNSALMAALPPQAYFAASTQPLSSGLAVNCVMGGLFHSDTRIYCVAPVQLPGVLDAKVGALIAGQSGASVPLTYQIAWTQLRPAQDVSRTGKPISLAGQGFDPGSTYMCRYAFNGADLGVPALSFVDAPASVANPKLLLCEQPPWPYASYQVRVSVRDLTRTTFGVVYAGTDPAGDLFTFLPGWDLVTPAQVVAGVPDLVTIKGGGFNITETRYVCTFTVASSVYRSPPASVPSFDMILCALPLATVNLGGLSAIVTINNPKVPGTDVLFNGDVADSAVQFMAGPPLVLTTPKLVAVTSFTASLSWTLPIPREANGATITKTRLLLNGQQAFQSNPSVLSFGLTGLFPGRRYEVRISYTNALGDSVDPGEALVFTTQRSAPILWDIQPPSGYQSGNELVLITGDQLGANMTDVAVKIGGQDCPIRAWTNASIQCLTPSSLVPGIANVLIVSSLGPSSAVPDSAAVPRLGNAMVFNYIPAPIIVSVRPPTTPLLSRSTVRITGSNLGTSSSDVASLSLAGVPCMRVTWISSREVACDAGVGTSTLPAPVVMRTLSGGAALRSVDFRFTTPLVTAVSPARVPLTGATVTVTGLYMGISFSDVTNITLGSWPVNLNTMSWSQDPLTTAISLVFRSPSVRELGSVPVTVTTASGGQSTSSIPTVMVTFYREKYTVLPPLTTAVVPGVGLFGGYQAVTIVGSNLGTSAADVVNVRLVGEPCTAVVWLNDSALLCSTPVFNDVATGVAMVETVSGGDGSGDARFMFASDKPVITAFNPKTSNLAGGGTLTLRGSNFGTQGRAIRVLLDTAVCQNPTWLSDSLATCVIPNVNATNCGAVYYSANNNATGSANGKKCVPSAPLGIILTTQGSDSNYAYGFRYGGECDPGCGWNGRCTLPSLTCECDRFYTNPPACEDPVVRAEALGSAVTAEDNAGRGQADASVRLVLSRAPTSDVVIELAVECATTERLGLPPPAQLVDPVTGDVVAGNRSVTVTFTPSDYATPRVLSLRSVSNAVRDGNVAFAVRVGPVNSSDPEFDGAPATTVAFTSVDRAPRISSILPNVSRPDTGINVTVTGAHFDPVVAVRINGVPLAAGAVDVLLSLSSSTYVMNMGTRALQCVKGPCPLIPIPTATTPALNATRRFRARETMPVLASAADLQRMIELHGEVETGRFPSKLPDPFTGEVLEVRVSVPPGEIGYQAIMVSNLDGQNVSMAKEIYLTNDCIREGYWGKGADCQPCPVGAVCPGGFRLYPQAGYWAPDETSGFVYACTPAEACQGGRGAPCSASYVGEYCQYCAKGSYRSTTTLCQPCPTPFNLFGLILGDLLAWLGMAMCGWFLRSSNNVARVAFAFMGMQLFGAVGKQVGPSAPSRVRRMHDFFRLFTGDYHFMKPECTPGGQVPFVKQIVVQIFYNLLMGAVIVLGVPVVRQLSRVWNRTQSPEVFARTLDFYAHRRRRMTTIWVTLVYLPLTCLGLQCMACRPVIGGHSFSSTYLLMADPSVRCFQGIHAFIFFVGMCLVLGVTIGWPVHIVRKLRLRAQWLYVDLNFLESYGYLYHVRKERLYLFGLVDLAVLTALNVSYAMLTSPALRFYVSAGALGTHLLLTLALRPFKRWFEALVSPLLTVIAFLGVGYNRLTWPDVPGGAVDQAKVDKLAPVTILAMASTFIVLTLTLAYLIFLRWKRRRKVVGEDYFVSKAIAQSFANSKVVGDFYLESLKNGADILDEVLVDADTGEVVKSPSEKARPVKVLKDTFMDEVLERVRSARSTSGREKRPATDGDGSDSISEDGGGNGGDTLRRPDLTSPRGNSAPFLSRAAARSTLNIYGNPVLDSSSSSDGWDDYGEKVMSSSSVAVRVAEDDLGGQIRARVAEMDGSEDSEEKELLQDTGLGVFFDEASGLEKWFDIGMNAIRSTLSRTPQDDAYAIKAHPINVLDPESVPPKRIHDINRALLLRRLQKAMLDLAQRSTRYVMCLRTFDQKSMLPRGPIIKRAPVTQRYIFPWSQTGSIAELLDAIVTEVTERAKIGMVHRLQQGDYAVLSDLDVITLDYPSKRMIIVHFFI